MSKISKGGLVGLLYNDFNQRQKSGVWSLEDHVANQNYIRTSLIPNNYLSVGCYNINSLILYDMFFKNKITTNIFNTPESTITCIDQKRNLLVYGLNKAPYLKIYNTETFTEYTLTQTIPGSIQCLKLTKNADYLFIGFLESQNNNTTHILVYNIIQLTTSNNETYIGTQGAQGEYYIPQNIVSDINIIVNFLPTCIKFTKDDEHLCIGHYGSVEDEFNNLTLYKNIDGVYTDISEYNLNSYQLGTINDVCFLEDKKYLFIGSQQYPYLFCYNYERQDLVNIFDTTIINNINSVVNCMLLTKDSKKLFIGCNISPYLYILDLVTNKTTSVSGDYFNDSIISMSFSYNDQYVCISTKDKGLKLFDYATKILIPVDLDILPETTTFSTCFFLGSTIEYIEIEKPLYSVSSNNDAIVAVASDEEIVFNGSYFLDGISVSSPDLAAHQNIFQSEIYYSLDYQNTYITSIKKDGTLITNDINILQTYNNIVQISTYNNRIALLDSYGSVHTFQNNSFSTEELYYLSTNFIKNIKQISVGNNIVLALTNDFQVLSSNLSLFDPEIVSLPSIIQVSTGDAHISLLTESNTVLSYGDNTHGQCNTQDWTDVKKVCCGNLFTIALSLNNQVYLVGNNIDQIIYDLIITEEDVIDIFAGPIDIMLIKSDNTVKIYTPTAIKTLIL